MNVNTITPDGEDESDHKLAEGKWAWITIPGGLTIKIADRGEYVEVSSYTTDDEFEALQTVCFDK